jgi:hypothetical protein
MSESIVLVDCSETREGKLAELKTAMKQLVEFVEASAARPLAYHMYIREDGTRMTVVQVHPDSESIELHMKVAGPAFAKFSELLKMSSMDVYGTPSPALLEQLRRKARMLGLSEALAVHELHAGFIRFRASGYSGR